MLVYISADMEGIAGVTTLDQIVRGGSGYARAQALMTAEANAAIRGAFAGGASEVVISDSHGTMDNLLVDQLDPRARLVNGGPRPSCMAQGLSARATLAVFLGYHAAAGAPGVLSHTFSVNFTEMRINGRQTSEAEVNALYAASKAVPIGVLTGDDQICEVARKAFPGVITVETKHAVGWSAAESLHPERAGWAIEAAVESAVSETERFVAPLPPDELIVEVDFACTLGADYAASMPGSRRIRPNTLAYDAADVDRLLQAIMSWYYLAALSAQQVSAVAHRR
ncbi:M55 family metallopeptidase [Nocardia vulneris]|uniref:M55 family metallopeptidase n=1 Tax=Nocardia vulneris TaxID=1141657 RepID=UPI0030CECD79